MVSPISPSGADPGFNFTLLQRLNDIRLSELNSTNRLFGTANTFASRTNFRHFSLVRINAPQVPGRIIATGRSNDIRVQGGFFALDFEGTERFSTSVTLDISNAGRVFDRTTGARLRQFDASDPSNVTFFELSKEDRTLSAGPSSGLSFSGNVSRGLGIGDSTTQDINLLGPGAETLQLDSEFRLTGENEITLNLFDPNSGGSLFEGVLGFNEEGQFESLSVPGIEENEEPVLSVPLGDDETLDFSAGDFDFSNLTLTDTKTTLESNQTGGFVEGELETLSINQSGELIGQYSNEKTRSFGPVAFARFANSSELKSSVGRLFETTPESGRPRIQAQESNRFSIQTGFLDVESPEAGRQFVATLLSQNQFQSPFLNLNQTPFQTFQFPLQTSGQLFDRFA